MALRRRPQNRKNPIKDQYDEVLETRGFYRKHVPHDGESLSRSISDAIFGSQKYKYIVTKAIELILNQAADDDERKTLSEHAPNYPLLRRLAATFSFDVEVVYAIDQTFFKFDCPRKNRKRKKKYYL